MTLPATQQARTDQAGVSRLFHAVFRPRAVADPYPVYMRLRELGPVLPVPQRGTTPTYLVTTFDECSQLLRDIRFGPLTEHHQDALRPYWRAQPFLRDLYRSMAFRSGADHRVRRALAARQLTPRRMRQWRQAAGEVASTLLDQLAERGTGDEPVDIQQTLAVPYASLAIGRLLSIPDGEALLLGQLVRQAGAAFETACSPAQRNQITHAGSELHSRMAALIRQRREKPRDDLISDLAAARTPTAGDNEPVSTLILLFGAGLDSPASAIGLGARLLLDHPDQARTVREDPDAASPAAAEILRYEPPVQVITRVVREEAQLGGTTLAEGGIVLALVAAANRDPTRVPDPDKFDVRRTPTPALSLGGGAHHCLGASIARTQCELLFPLLTRRFPRMELAEPPTYRHPGTALRGLDHLPARLNTA